MAAVAWYAVQIFQPPHGQARSFRAEKQESEPQAVARMGDTARRFESAATLWRWNGKAWVHAGPWAWVNVALYRQLLAQGSAAGAASTWGRA